MLYKYYINRVDDDEKKEEKNDDQPDSGDKRKYCHILPRVPPHAKYNNKHLVGMIRSGIYKDHDLIDDVSSKTSSESGSESGSESESDSNRNKYVVRKSKCPMSIIGDILDEEDSEEEEEDSEEDGEGSEVSSDESGRNEAD